MDFGFIGIFFQVLQDCSATDIVGSDFGSQALGDLGACVAGDNEDELTTVVSGIFSGVFERDVIDVGAHACGLIIGYMSDSGSGSGSMAGEPEGGRTSIVN